MFGTTDLLNSLMYYETSKFTNYSEGISVRYSLRKFPTEVKYVGLSCEILYKSENEGAEEAKKCRNGRKFNVIKVKKRRSETEIFFKIGAKLEYGLQLLWTCKPPMTTPFPAKQQRSPATSTSSGLKG